MHLAYCFSNFIDHVTLSPGRENKDHWKTDRHRQTPHVAFVVVSHYRLQIIFMLLQACLKEIFPFLWEMVWGFLEIVFSKDWLCMFGLFNVPHRRQNSSLLTNSFPIHLVQFSPFAYWLQVDLVQPSAIRWAVMWQSTDYWRKCHVTKYFSPFS